MGATPLSPIVIVGAHSSPYSRKMRAVLRYRHIPHDWVVRGSRWDDTPASTVAVVPKLAWRDGKGGYAAVMVDSLTCSRPSLKPTFSCWPLSVPAEPAFSASPAETLPATTWSSPWQR